MLALRKFRTCVYGAFALIFATAGSVSHTAAATLVDQGDFTLDTATNLQWLDVPITLGVNFGHLAGFQIGSNLFTDLYPGFHYATAAQVAQLFADAGITVGTSGPNSETPNFQNLLLLIGFTGIDGTTFFTKGYVANTPGLYALLSLTIGGQQVADPQHDVLDQIVGWSDVGSFLVRDSSATPLPAALPLFATGLGALGLLRWRRKKKHAAALP